LKHEFEVGLATNLSADLQTLMVGIETMTLETRDSAPIISHLRSVVLDTVRSFKLNMQTLIANQKLSNLSFNQKKTMDSKKQKNRKPSRPPPRNVRPKTTGGKNAGAKNALSKRPKKLQSNHGPTSRKDHPKAKTQSKAKGSQKNSQPQKGQANRSKGRK
ncbi:hypothetical protein BGZ99_002347, partial [Dissophora globulifera]